MKADHQITLRQLRALAALAETGNFRRAAERLGITQPSLSAQIAGLEAALGTALIERSRHGALPTPAGREAVRRARGICEAVTAMADSFATPERSLGGALRLGASPTVGPYLLPSVVARLRAEYPGLSLLIREGPPAALAGDLAEGVHDLALLQLPVREAALEAEEVLREPLYLVLPAGHPLAAEERVRPEALAGLEVLTLDPRFRLHDTVTELCDRYGARVLGGYEGTSLDALRLMTGMAMGVTFLPALYVRSEIRGDEVVARPLAGRTVARRIGLAWRRSAAGAVAYRQLAALLRETAARLLRGA